MVAEPNTNHPRISQNNFSSGTFVARDNYGTINAIDDATRGVLDKLAKEAPPLAQLLRKALRDGLVSPDVVYSLEFAARSINEDVAHALYAAGRNINEDVAQSLWSASDKLERAVSPEKLNAFVHKIESLVGSLETASNGVEGRLSVNGRNAFIDRLDETVDNICFHADRIEGVVTPPPAQIVVAWKPTFYAFVFGFIAGMALLAYIMNR